MLKTGKFRAIRNLPVGWTVQAIHSTDLSERVFRVLLECIIFYLCWYIYFQKNGYSVIQSFLIVHTANWFMTGNFWVYMLDSFKWVKNPGIISIIKFTKKLSSIYKYFNCCDAILIYGSMCRNQFHIRSDLDLRIIRRSDSKFGLICLIIAFFIRCYSFFKLIPVDLQVVDSLNFLKYQMRSDEKPIVVFKRAGFIVDSAGMNFEDIILNPQTILKRQ